LSSNFDGSNSSPYPCDDEDSLAYEEDEYEEDGYEEDGYEEDGYEEDGYEEEEVDGAGASA